MEIPSLEDSSLMDGSMDFKWRNAFFAATLVAKYTKFNSRHTNLKKTDHFYFWCVEGPVALLLSVTATVRHQGTRQPLLR